VFHLTVATGLGLCIFVSTEQGLAALGVHGLLILAIPIKFRNPLARMIIGSFTGVAAILIFIGCTALVSGNYTAESLKFLLTDLPKDQFWYFGAPPNIIPSFPAILWNYRIVIGVWMPLMLMMLEILHIRSIKEIPMDSITVLALLGMAMVVQIPQLASYSHYQSVATRNMGLVVMLWAYRMMQWPALTNHPLVARILNRKLILLLAACSCLAAAVGFPLFAFRLAAKRERESGGRQYAGMTVSKGWASDLAVWDELATKETKVAGTYRALVEDRQGSAFRGPDYIIHALGSRRGRFLENLIRYDPDFFLTLKPDFFQYEEWLQLRHWDIYQLLLRRYTPVRASDHHVFWKKRQEQAPPQPNPVVIQTTTDGGFRVSPPNQDAACIYTVKVRYAISNPFGAIPVIGKVPRYLVSREILRGFALTPGIPASLPPGETSWEFPIILGPGEQARFSLKTALALPGGKAEILSIEMVETSRDPMAIEALTHGGKLPGATSR
jgi:hypothetical protein